MSDERKKTTGNLRIDTGDRQFTVPVEDLSKFPDCILTKCMETSESDDATIQLERDSEYLDLIFKYMHNANRLSIYKLKQMSIENLLNILGEAQYLMLDELAERCKKALLEYNEIDFNFARGSTVPHLTSVNEYRQKLALAREQKKGLLIINVDHADFNDSQKWIFEHIRQLDLYQCEIFTVANRFNGEATDHSGIFSYKMPGSDTVEKLETVSERSLSELIYKLIVSDAELRFRLKP